MGQAAPGTLETRLRGLMPRGMTPLTDSLAAEGIDIRAHVVGFGLSAVEIDALSCITDQTGGMLLQTNSRAELAAALQQVSMAAPAPEVVPEPEPEPVPQAAFDTGDKAEAGFDYRIRWTGEAGNVDFMGFVPQGEDRAPSSGSYRTIGGTGANPNNPATRTAPLVPGMYDLIIRTARAGVIARQAVEVVAPAMGFEAIGSVAPGSRVRFVFRGPEQLEERIGIADLDQPVNEHQRHGWSFALSTNGATTLTVPTVPATFRLPPDVPQSDVTWDAMPLDPDMDPEAWASLDTGPVTIGVFEPGYRRVTARAPGEMVLTVDVAIFPGQGNDFTVALTAQSADLSLDGDWTVWAIPPPDVADAPVNMARITLIPSPEGQD